MDHENEYLSSETTSNEASGQAPQPESASTATPPESQESSSGQISDKYKGKSLEDVIEMHRNLESKLGELGAERALWKERHDELAARIRQLEFSGKSQQAVPADEDPVKLLQREVEQDPLQAIVNFVNRATGKVAQKVDGVYNSVRTENARKYVQTQLRDNPDFKENFDTMVELERQYGGLIRPEYAGSEIAYQLLYDLARAKNLARYEQRAAEKAQAAKQQIRNEKKAAFAESSTSARSGGSEDDFERLSLEEMEARLPKADYYR